MIKYIFLFVTGLASIKGDLTPKDPFYDSLHYATLSNGDFQELQIEEDNQLYKTQAINLLSDLLTLYSQLIQEQQSKISDLKSTVDTNSRLIMDLETQLAYCQPISCRSFANQSGVFEIKVPQIEAFRAVCDAEIAGSGWMVIYRRTTDKDSSNFQRDWQTYENGFGDFDDDFFIGLKKLYYTLKSEPHELYVHLSNEYNETSFAHYDNFSIGNASESYMLKTLGKFSGDARDFMSNRIDGKFSTYDRDNDGVDSDNCASASVGAWWYKGACDRNMHERYLGNYNMWASGTPWPKYIASVQFMIRSKLD
ncbi:ficolin-1-like [Scaptodrosophila lebanonensis]|uniref:Ficolin-1-like n=1 Tax=Drosophila lebanonensis TaxID=7225 RepID=A0A6J2U7Y8_DROLE|nr:ficolin-1-like [Scaptodrosophila lebanonensis]